MNLLFIFTIILFQWSLDLADPRTQYVIQHIFFCIHCLLALGALGTAVECFRRNEKETVTYEDTYSKEKISQSVRAYDTGSLAEMVFLKMLMPAVISYIMAKRTGLYFPLMVQCWNNPKMLYKSEVVQIYLFNEKAEGVLQRPWTKNGMVPEWLSNAWDQAGKTVDKFEKGSSPSPKSKKKK